MTEKTEVDGFWTGPVWREIETFACGMAGVPPPSQKRYGPLPVSGTYYRDAEEVEEDAT